MRDRLRFILVRPLQPLFFLLASLPEGFDLKLLHDVVLRARPLLLRLRCLGGGGSHRSEQLAGVDRLWLPLDRALHIGHCHAMRLHILHVVVDLYVERRLINLNLIVSIEPLHQGCLVEHTGERGRLGHLLRYLRVRSQRLPGRLCLPPDHLRLLPDVVLDEVVDQLVQMCLAVVYLWEVAIFVSHGVQHHAQLFEELLCGLVLAEMLLAVLDELGLDLLDQFLTIERLRLLGLLVYVAVVAGVLIVQQAEHVVLGCVDRLHRGLTYRSLDR